MSKKDHRGGAATIEIVKKVGGTNRHPHSCRFKVIDKAVVDRRFVAHLRQFRWTLVCGYPTSYMGGRRQKRLHSVVWKMSGGHLPKHPDSIDHKNRDKLDCRLRNLRVASQSLQKANRGSFRNNTSGFKGVCWSKREGKWMAFGNVAGRQKTLGYFVDRTLAALAVNRFYREHYPSIPVPNQVPDECAA